MLKATLSLSGSVILFTDWVLPPGKQDVIRYHQGEIQFISMNINRLRIKHKRMESGTEVRDQKQFYPYQMSI